MPENLVDAYRMKQGPQFVINERLYGLNLCDISKPNESFHTVKVKANLAIAFNVLH